MKREMKSTFILLSLLFIINCTEEPKNPTEVQINKYSVYQIELSESQYILSVPETNPQKMSIELIFTHPSRFDFTINKYNDPSTSEEEINYKKNNTDLIKTEKSGSGKNIIGLNLPNTIEKIILTVFPKINENNNSTNSNNLYYFKIKYKIAREGEDNPSYFDLKDNGLSMSLQGKRIELGWNSIKQYSSDEKKNDANFMITYNIFLFDKQNYEAKIENIYSIFTFEDYKQGEIRPLISTNIVTKGEMSGERNFMRINATENEQKQQFIIIFATATDGIDEEIFVYSPINFYISGTENVSELSWGTKMLIAVAIIFGIVAFIFMALSIYIIINRSTTKKIRSSELENVGTIDKIQEETPFEGD